VNEVLEHLAIPLLAVLSLALLLGFVFARLASAVDLLDQPDWRKQHSGNIPLAGGPAIFAAVLIVAVWQGGWSHATQTLGWTSAIVFLAGLLDDRRHIRVGYRFAVQIIALAGMIWVGGVMLHNFGNLFWERLLGLGPLAVPITIFSALGVINALNMIDGLDGLAGSLVLISLGGLAFLAGRGGFVEEHTVLLILFGAVLGFLLLNVRFPWRRRALVFLGDSGSSWLGFVLAWFFIALSQDDPANGIKRAYAPITAIWLFGLPLMDTTYVMIRRARLREPIFGSDRRHLHHIFLRSGFSVRQTWAVMTGAALALAAIGIIGELRGWAEWGMFYGYVGLSLLYLVWMNRVWRRREFLGRPVG
jgi:UDP-GlcNAc:undecaprenyl-phosphate GlcNAc-1-phosphate transferase